MHEVKRGPVAVLDALAAHFLPRAGAVKVGRRSDQAARAAVARPYLDGPEHGRTMMEGGAAQVESDGTGENSTTPANKLSKTR